MSQIGGPQDSQENIIEKIADSEVFSPESIKPRQNGKHFLFPETSSDRFVNEVDQADSSELELEPPDQALQQEQ
jgi:hypothetical protein